MFKLARVTTRAFAAIRPTNNQCQPHTSLILSRHFHDEFNTALKKPTNNAKDVPAAVASKYQVFKDEDATLILDVDEERQRHNEDVDDEEQEMAKDIYSGLNMEREWMVSVSLCIRLLCMICVYL